ncbi:MAG: hypothetical protein LBD12_01235, partial [Clostridiales Family XIII bacterium]|nr:hypothetical protein [Clostridiales Family XIII bacterium]
MRQGSGALGGALSTNNLPLVQALLAQENRQPDGRLQDAVAQCGSEIRRVSSLLAQFRSEDQAYHAALAAAAAAAAAA